MDAEAIAESDLSGDELSEFIDEYSKMRQSEKEPCETCERPHDPNEPCGTRFPEP